MVMPAQVRSCRFQTDSDWVDGLAEWRNGLVCYPAVSFFLKDYGQDLDGMCSWLHGQARGFARGHWHFGLKQPIESLIDVTQHRLRGEWSKQRANKWPELGALVRPGTRILGKHRSETATTSYEDEYGTQGMIITCMRTM